MATLLRAWLACAVAVASSAVAQAPEFTITRDGHTVRYKGLITPASAIALNRHIDDGARHIDIDSPGGDSAAGLAIANNMRSRGVSISVPSYCLSSCANYLFLAASQKSLAPRAVLGFHGGVHARSMTKADRGNHPGLAKLFALMDESQAFYDRIGFNVKLLDHSTELTKLPPGQGRYEVRSKDGKTEVLTTASAADAAIAALRQTKNFKSVTRHFTSGNLVYFPNRPALESCGVSNIVAYPYPASSEELAGRGPLIGPEMQVVGDLPGPAFACSPQG